MSSPTLIQHTGSQFLLLSTLPLPQDSEYTVPSTGNPFPSLCLSNFHLSSQTSAQVFPDFPDQLKALHFTFPYHYTPLLSVIIIFTNLYLFLSLLFGHQVLSDSFATLWTIARQVSLSMGFPRHEFWSGLQFPSPGDLPNPGIEFRSPALQTDSSPLSHLT